MESSVQTAVKGLSKEDIIKFIETINKFLDALVVQGHPVKIEPELEMVDYNKADLDRSGPEGGWLSTSEVREQHRLMTEAITAEKWEEGFIVALRIVAMFGGAL